MPTPGRPKALAEKQRATVCSLVAGGVSIRQAARYVGCAPSSIRREAERNEEFRRELTKARSEASIHPMQTLVEAAKTNWRAAAFCMKRIDPDRFARPDASIITQREANQLVADLIESIERAISSPQERKAFIELLTPAMPNAMRRRWNGRSMRRAVGEATHVFDNRKADQDRRERREKAERNFRRRKLWHEVGQWLPKELYDKFAQNEDLFDPEEVFTQPPGPGPLVKDPRSIYKPGSVGAQGGRSPFPDTHHPTPIANNGPPPSRNSDDVGSPPIRNTQCPFDLPRQAEPIATE
jgi:hypothetical protein